MITQDAFAITENAKSTTLIFPMFIAVRNQLLPAGEREINIATDLNDLSWLEKIDASDGIVLFAAGVFYYFRTEQVKKLVQAMSNVFGRRQNGV